MIGIILVNKGEREARIGNKLSFPRWWDLGMVTSFKIFCEKEIL